MEAIVLAGGMGTRLREVVPDLPKPMAPVNGKPFLYFIFQWLKKYSVNKIILSAGFKSEKIIEFFGDTFDKIPIEYVIEEKPLGTGGAVRFALRKTTGNNILILNGDTYFPIDLNSFYSFHTDNHYMFSVALKRMKAFSRYGSVECHDNTIIKFNEKKFSQDGLINGGIYLAGRKFLESKLLEEVFSLEKDILENEAGSSILKCMEFEDTFVDIGIPEDYLRAGSILKISKT
jgi:D-glycero-alpha-D-manno-heptose 1-phosphate guanylyltransferase